MPTGCNVWEYATPRSVPKVACVKWRRVGSPGGGTNVKGAPSFTSAPQKVISDETIESVPRPILEVAPAGVPGWLARGVVSTRTYYWFGP
eukprot:scaffold3820_cov415-Prasinococcus_capsulatus_cf.AAC.2